MALELLIKQDKVFMDDLKLLDYYQIKIKYKLNETRVKLYHQVIEQFPNLYPKI